MWRANAAGATHQLDAEGWDTPALPSPPPTGTTAFTELNLQLLFVDMKNSSQGYFIRKYLQSILISETDDFSKLEMCRSGIKQPFKFEIRSVYICEDFGSTMFRY